MCFCTGDFPVARNGASSEAMDEVDTWTIRRRRSGTLCRQTGKRRGRRAPSWCRAGRCWSRRRGRACRRSPRRGSSRCSSRGRCTCACRRCRPGPAAAAAGRCRRRRRRRRQDGPGARRGRGSDEASFFLQSTPNRGCVWLLRRDCIESMAL